MRVLLRAQESSAGRAALLVAGQDSALFPGKNQDLSDLDLIRVADAIAVQLEISSQREPLPSSDRAMFHRQSPETTV